jgi:D-arabinose 5-phosphate isomerase GutQ
MFAAMSIFLSFHQARARKGDVLLAISTSGKRANVIALTGTPNSPLSPVATTKICTPGGSYVDPCPRGSYQSHSHTDRIGRTSAIFRKL